MRLYEVQMFVNFHHSIYVFTTLRLKIPNQDDDEIMLFEEIIYKPC